jgi:hypothetical protein
MTRPGAAAGLVGIFAMGACAPVATPEAEIEGGLPNPARSACMAAVASETGDGNVTVLSEASTFMGGSDIVVGVGESRAPWRCRTDSDGSVREVSAMTGGGAT